MKSKYSSLILMSSLIIAVGTSCEETITEAEETLRPLVNVEKAEHKKFVHKIQVQGNVETEQDVLLSSEMGGLIISIDVREGQRIAKGQVIATIDASVLTSNMQELQTQLQYAEYMLSKQEELKKRGVGSEIDLETAKSNVNALKASIESLSTQRGKSVIRAPFSGVIDQVFAKQGQMAGPASPIARLVNNNEIDIVASISEKHFAKVSVGTEMEVRFPNYSDTTIYLKITSVGNYIEPTNRTFRIKSTIKDNHYFLPNMVAELSISDMEIDNGLVIPSASILKDQDNQDYVYVAEPYSDKSSKDEHLYIVHKVNVKIIERFEGNTLIEDDNSVKEGSFIVVEGARGISENEIVRTSK